MSDALPVLAPPDLRGRRLRDLRISVTDRCNLRCPYCMPREVFGADWPFLDRAAVLSFEEIERLAGVFVGLGVRKLRLTGGEPLMRRELSQLVARLSRFDVDLALTTNGVLLPRHAEALAAAGLGRVTVSLDALDEGVYQKMSDAPATAAAVLAGIAAAERAGFRPIKVNCVVVRGVNEGEVLPLVEHFRGSGNVLRFIEFMDVGTTNGWRAADVVPAAELRATIARSHPLEPLPATYAGEVARRWRLADGSLELGFVASVSEPFCGDCTRARLSAEGKLFTCLFASEGHDLRALLRSGAGDDELRQRLRAIWGSRDDRYSELRDPARTAEHAEMSYLGG